jgi:ATP-dependent DNA helicase
MDLTLQRQRQLETGEDESDSGGVSTRQGKRRRKDGKSSPRRKRIKLDIDENDTRIFKQPRLITGTKLKDYQLEGVAWMAGLHENGISGILADDMGLGKVEYNVKILFRELITPQTLQTIAFSAYLRGRMRNPFLVVCPLSVLHNWQQEYTKFSPQASYCISSPSCISSSQIPVCVYHGTPQERAEMRSTVMSLDLIPEDEEPEDEKPKPRPVPRDRKGKRQPTEKVQKSTRKKEPSPPVEAEDPGIHETEESIHARALRNKFPVVLTTYDIIMKDRSYLTRYPWGFIVVDEGHRLKNMDCKLMQEIKQYVSAGRMILTGTPLHVSLQRWL